MIQFNHERLMVTKKYISVYVCRAWISQSTRDCDSCTDMPDKANKDAIFECDIPTHYILQPSDKGIASRNRFVMFFVLLILKLSFL
jgi:hypothetical protein